MNKSISGETAIKRRPIMLLVLFFFFKGNSLSKKGETVMMRTPLCRCSNSAVVHITSPTEAERGWRQVQASHHEGALLQTGLWHHTAQKQTDGLRGLPRFASISPSVLTSSWRPYVERKGGQEI